MQNNINENIEKLVQKSRNIEEILSKNDLVGDFTALQKELSIDRPEVLKNALEEKQNTDRDLNLAIIGAVKAGKRSFINALMFDGKSVLPKAATSMTAALSVLEYSDNFEAIVEFYTKKDKVEIKAKYEAAKQMLKDLETKHIQSLTQRLKDTKTAEQIRESAKINSLQDFKKDSTLYAYYDQYDRMQKSSTEPQGDTKSIQASSIEELVGNIEEYVGANGKYMPFTKSIILRFKDERLKGIRIVDVPGVNDPFLHANNAQKNTLQNVMLCYFYLVLGSFK